MIFPIKCDDNELDLADASSIVDVVADEGSVNKDMLTVFADGPALERAVSIEVSSEAN